MFVVKEKDYVTQRRKVRREHGANSRQYAVGSRQWAGENQIAESEKGKEHREDISQKAEGRGLGD